MPAGPSTSAWETYLCPHPYKHSYQLPTVPQQSTELGEVLSHVCCSSDSLDHVQVLCHTNAFLFLMRDVLVFIPIAKGQFLAYSQSTF